MGYRILLRRKNSRIDFCFGIVYAFADGMSGGIAFVYDVTAEFSKNCNPEMVDIDPVFDNGDKMLLRESLEEHIACTSS